MFMYASLSVQVSTFCLGQNLQELVIRQEEKSWKSEPFRFEIIVQTYMCVSINKCVDEGVNY